MKNIILKSAGVSLLTLTGALLFKSDSEPSHTIKGFQDSPVEIEVVRSAKATIKQQLNYNKTPISHPRLIVNEIIDSKIINQGENTVVRKSLLKTENIDSMVILEETFSLNENQEIEFSGNKEYLANEILVSIDAESSLSIEEIEEKTGYEFKRGIDDINLYNFTIPNANIDSTQEAIKVLAEIETIKKSSVNALAWAAGTPNDPNFPSQWELLKIQMEAAWDIKETSFKYNDDPVIIAIIDTGVPISSVEIDAWKNPNEIPNNGIDDDNNGYIDDYDGWDFYSPGDSNVVNETGHGKTVSLIAGSVTNNSVGEASPAGHVKIMPLQALSPIGTGSSYDVMEAAFYAAKNGADIINISVLGGSDWHWKGILQTIDENGALVCAAAGNDIEDLDTAEYLTFPACSAYRNNLISVGASNSSDKCVSSYSDTYVDVFAPGSATSWATPLVASTAALLLADDPTLSPSELKSRITNGVDVVSILEDKCISSGRINALKSLQLNTLRRASDINAQSNNGSITISWNDNATCEIAYEIERCSGTQSTADNNWVLISDTIAANQTSYTDNSVSSNENYFYRVRPVGLEKTSVWPEDYYVALANTSEPNEDNIIAPSEIFADYIGLDYVEFSWNDNADNELAYLIQRKCPGENAFYDYAILDADSTNFVDSSLEENSCYNYRVSAYNENTISNCAEIAITTAQLEAPCGSINLSYQKISNTEITLNWNDPFDNEDAFIIEYDLNGTGFYELSLDVNITANNTSISLENLEEGATHSLRIFAMNAAGSSELSNTVTFVSEAPVDNTPAPDTNTVDPIDLNNAVIENISNQASEDIVELQDNGESIFLDGNTWTTIEYDCNVTENTVIEFDFQSTQEGEIHGIAFYTSNRYASNIKYNVIQVYGIQNWNGTRLDYEENGWQHYKVEVGQIYQGNMSHIVLINDGDSISGNSHFKNIKVYDANSLNNNDKDTDPAVDPVVDPALPTDGNTDQSTPAGPDSTNPSALTIDFNNVIIKNISSQASDNTYEVQENGNTLFIEGNTWTTIEYDCTITEDTVIEFDFKSTKEGEIHGIAFYTSNQYKSDIKHKIIQTYGVQSWNTKQLSYSEDGWQHYRVEVGQIYQGEMSHIILVNDGDSVQGNSFFKNLSVYDLVDPNTTPDTVTNPDSGSNSGTGNTPDTNTDPITDPDLNPDSDTIDVASINLNNTTIKNISSQASDNLYEVQDNGETIFLEGNTWTTVEHAYTLTENTVIEFDFKSTQEGEIHGLAFYTSSKYQSDIKHKIVQVHGSQSWNKVELEYDENGWQHYKVEIGQIYQGEMSHIILVNDGDSVEGNSFFSNIKVYEK